MSALKPYLCSEREVLNGLYIVRGKTRPYTHAAPRYTILANKARKQSSQTRECARVRRLFNHTLQQAVQRKVQTFNIPAVQTKLKTLGRCSAAAPAPGSGAPAAARGARRLPRARSRPVSLAASRRTASASAPSARPHQLGHSATVSAAPIVTVGAAPIVRYSLDTNQRIQIPQHGPRAARRRPRPCARAR